MKITPDIDIRVEIKPMIYFNKPISTFIEKQAQIIVERECFKLEKTI